ncbi:MAG: hypothetical protein FD123_2694 [Bacteroidetes bacterium]|nr:MAG: hypothetical protein FD123_2694 [Bacteroidota bacterium]
MFFVPIPGFAGSPAIPNFTVILIGTTMKKRTILLWATLFPVIAMAQQGIHYTYKFSSEKSSGIMNGYYSEAGTRSEMEATAPNPKDPKQSISIKSVGITMKDKPDVRYVLDEKNKSYTEYKNTAHTGNKETYTVKIVGDEKVGSYNCKHVQLTDSKGKVTEEWVTKDVADYEKLKEIASTSEYVDSDGMSKALKAAGVEGMMVKMKNAGARGETVTVELVLLERKVLDVSLFKIPADYKKTETPVMPGAGGMPDFSKMTPEEQKQWLEQMKKQYSTPPSGSGGGN